MPACAQAFRSLIARARQSPQSTTLLAVHVTMAVQRTLALIKPDACGQAWYDKVLKRPEEPEEELDEEEAAARPAWVEVQELRAPDKAEEILKRIKADGFTIVKSKIMRLSIDQAQEFYAEHAGKPFFGTLTQFMSSGPIMALMLEAPDAIAKWRALMGPTNTFKAQEAAAAEHPINQDSWCLRALFGTDGTRNATHGSDSPWTAMRELNFFFPTPGPWQRAAVAITPEAVTAGHTEDIKAALTSKGLWEVHCADAKLTPEAAEAFNAAGPGLGASPAAVAAAARGTSHIVVLEGPDAVRRVHLALGPPTLDKAKDASPTSLRATWGTSDDALAVLAPACASDVDAALAAALGPNAIPLEKTLAVIKPGTASTHYAAIVRAIVDHGFVILAEKRVTLPRERVEAFYAEHKGKFFFNRLVSYMTSGSVVALVLAKAAAIKSWRALMGPTNTFTARRDAPASLRARFGVDGTRNATHGSDSPDSAAREIRFYFPGFNPAPPLPEAAAREYIRMHPVARGYHVGKGEVTETLHTVLTRGLVELCKEKPHGLASVAWLGNWLLEHNPRTGFASEEGQPSGVGASHPPGASVRILEPEEGKDFDEDLPLAEEVLESKEGSVGVGAGADDASPAGSTVAKLDLGPGASIVFVLGGPGSGKGTQCERLSKALGYTHLSTGDLLRAEVASGSDLGQSLSATMKAGGLIDTNTVLTLLRNAMASSGSKKFLIDGYPRALDQAFAFEAMAGSPAFVLEFTASEESLVQRLVKRGESSGRADDNEASIRLRLETFHSESAPVLDFYRKLGLVRSVSSEGKAVDAVYDEAVAAFQPHLVAVVGQPGGHVAGVLQHMQQDGGYTVLDEDALVAAEIDSGSELGLSLRSLREAGDNVPTGHVLTLMKAAVEGAPHAKFALANFPRTKASAKAMEGALGPPRLVLHVPGKGVAPPPRGSAAKAAHEKACRIYANGTTAMLTVYRAQGLVRDVPVRGSLDRTWAGVQELLAPRVVFVLGGPGSGKGTQCANIVKHYGYTHLSAGDLLRAEVARGSAEGSMIESCMATGALVPQEVTVGLLRTAMATSGNDKFLIDGFPRAMDQAEAFEAIVGHPSFVLFFDCPEGEMRKRLLHRGETSGRVDDNEEAIVKRFRTFQQASMPVIQHYARQGRVRSIDATPAPEEVFKAVKRVFDPSIVFVLGGPGSGKGTQCANIVKHYGYTHLSAGDLLRAEVARGSAEGSMIESCMATGALVPQEVTVGLLRTAMATSGNDKFLIDGFPRAMDQAEAFEAIVGHPSFVLFFDCPEGEMRKRLLHRGETSGRVDDNEEAIVKRFRTFQERSLPVIQHYAKSSLVRAVSSQAPPDLVFAEVRKAFTTDLVVLIGAAGSGRGEFLMRAGQALGYAPIRVTELLRAEAENPDSPWAADIRLALDTKRTAPLAATMAVIRQAMAGTTATRYILDGYPRVVSQGYPRVSDQVFALEEAVGPVKGAILLETARDARTQRVAGGAELSVGEAAALEAAVDTFQREKVPVSNYFDRVGKLLPIDTAVGAEGTFAAALPFLESTPPATMAVGRSTALHSGL